MKGLELTSKQKIFCEEYVIDWNATRAAKAAGYSEKTAHAIGIENLKKPIIADYIELIQKDLAKLCGVSAARNIIELKKIAFSSMHNYKNDWMTMREWESISEDDKAAISGVDYQERPTEHGTERVVKFKLYDKHKAFETLNKMLGWNAPEKTINTNINTDNLSDEQLEKEIEQLKKKYIDEN